MWCCHWWLRGWREGNGINAISFGNLALLLGALSLSGSLASKLLQVEGQCCLLRVEALESAECRWNARAFVGFCLQFDWRLGWLVCKPSHSPLILLVRSPTILGRNDWLSGEILL